MSQTKKITLSAMMDALGTAFKIIGAVIEVLDLTVCALASMLVVFIFLEIGSYYPWLVWVCTSLATGLLYPASLIWVEYALIFGVYPLIKAYIEKLYADINALYRLDQRGNNGNDVSGDDLGPLPTASVILLCSIGGVWVMIILYVLSEKIKNAKK